MEKTKFINLNLDESVQLRFLVKHILYSCIWILGISIFVFRLDLSLVSFIANDHSWIIKTIPILFIVLVLLVMFKTKWYYNLVLIFYPLILVFWFFPKLILQRGKIYLLSHYLGYIFRCIKNYKRSFFLILIFIFTIFVLLISNSNVVRIFSMIVMAIYYYKFLLNYVKSSFRPAQLFGISVEKSIDEFLNSPDKKILLVKSIEDGTKNDSKLTDEEKKNKNLKSFIVINFLIEAFDTNLKGFKGKKAFVISWLYQSLGFLLVSIIFFTFLNYELFNVNKTNFTLTGDPTLFDFVYYTLKTITFNNTLEIIPSSPLSKIIETFTFFTLGIFLLVIITSVIFTLRQDKINENISKASDLCLQQNKAIVEHIKEAYETDITTVLNESLVIKKSLESIKKTVGKIF